MTQTYDSPVAHTEYIAWILAANPFVTVSDAVPYSYEEPEEGPSPQYFGYVNNEVVHSPGVMEGVSQLVRQAQAGPDLEVTCEEARRGTQPLPQETPIWPLGLGLQVLLAVVLLLVGRRRLTKPAKRLAQGTRIA